MTLRILAFLCASVLCVAAAPQTREFIYDDTLSLHLEAGRARPANLAAWDVRLSARLSPGLVDHWSRAGQLTRSADGAPNPDYGKARGYRVWFSVRRDGVPLEPVETLPGTGPLADRVGVYPAKLGDITVWTTAASASATFRHLLSSGPAEYECTWYIDARPVHGEKITLPPAKGEAGDTDGGLAPAVAAGEPPAETPGAANPPALPTVTEPGAAGIIQSAVLCLGLDARNQPVNPGTSFPAGSPELSLLVSHWLPAREQATLMVTLERKQETVLRHEVDITGEGRFVISFRPSAASGFSAGPWRVTIANAGAIVRALDFTID